MDIRTMIAIKFLLLCCLQLIISTRALPTNGEVVKEDEKKAFTLDDVTSNVYSSVSFNGTWISETEIFYRIDELLLIFDVTIQESQVIANDSIFDDEENVKYYLSPDRNFVLVRNQTQKVYRHSSLSQFSIYDVNNKSLKQLENGQLISVAIWAPQGSEIVYVFKNDIYHHQARQGETRRLTFDGSPQILYNGVPDWVYEEEVFSGDRALWISPNGDYLAFGTFNDSRVPEAVVTRFGSPGEQQYQYPKQERFRYPKVGAINPQVTLNFINLKAKQSSIVALKTPVDKLGSEAILYAVTWFDDKTLVATWSNRVQNESVIASYSVDGVTEPRHLLEQKVSDGWLLYAPSVPLYRKGYVLILKAQPVANKTLGSFGHLTRYTLRNGRLEDELDLTPGETWVYSIRSVNEDKGLIYFLACPPGKPTQKHLYRVELEPSSTPVPKCISCKGIVTPEGNECKYVNSVKFSSDSSRYVLACAGPDPTVVKIYDSNGARELYVWSDNQALRQMLARRVLTERMDLTLPLNGFDVAVRLQLPKDFDSAKKYPLYVNVYAGPGSQAITDNFAVTYASHLTTAKNVIEAKIDGRGSNSRGTAMLYSVYRRLGSAEMQDQIEATKILQEKFSFIDKNRTAIHGWSYGGFSTATILTKDKDNVFKCGSSGAPVTDWRFYDSIYTERYMGLLDDNLKGYEDSAVMKRAKNLRGKRLLLIHGMGDDNVHVDNSMALSKALAENDIMFEQFIYPDEAHEFVHLTHHLTRVTDNFISKCFGFKVDN